MVYGKKRRGKRRQETDGPNIAPTGGVCVKTEAQGWFYI